MLVTILPLLVRAVLFFCLQYVDIRIVAMSEVSVIAVWSRFCFVLILLSFFVGDDFVLFLCLFYFFGGGLYRSAKKLN